MMQRTLTIFALLLFVTAVQSFHPWYYCYPGGLYNSLTHLCCNYQIVVKGPNNACCGTTPINYLTQRCCGSQVYPAGSLTKCCYYVHWPGYIHYYLC
ncbi:galaxin-like [Octopus sinensis]|uniref:Galaxin-like n=1 Tax=Octopus sinensis TaxID=2607531 RepID=A0A7E6F0J0_9MOLL|nr:galaxin-like [Octopus sinensis]